jgi:hypothetical protein
MAEQATIDTAVPATPEAVVEAPAPGSFVNPDGTFKEGWDKALVPEDFQGRNVYKSFVDLPSLMKLIGNQDATIKRQGKGLMVPDEKATPTEKEAFYKALGRPDKPEDYKVNIPPELAQHSDPAIIADFRKFAFEKGYTQQNFDAAVEFDLGRYQKGAQAQQQATIANRERITGELNKEYGPAYNERMGIANRLISENLPAEEVKELTGALGDSKALIHLLANIGVKFMEAKGVSPEGGDAAMTTAEARNKAKELMESPGYVDGSMPEAMRKKITDQVHELYAQAARAGQK